MPPLSDPNARWASWMSAQIIAEFVQRNRRVVSELPEADRDRLSDRYDKLLKWPQPELSGRPEPPSVDKTYLGTRLTEMLDNVALAKEASTLASLPAATEMIATSVLLESREPGKVVVVPGSHADVERRLVEAVNREVAGLRQRAYDLNSITQHIAAAVTQSVNAAGSASHNPPRAAALAEHANRSIGSYAPPVYGPEPPPGSTRQGGNTTVPSRTAAASAQSAGLPQSASTARTGGSPNQPSASQPVPNRSAPSPTR